MADSRFFERAGPFTLAELARLSGSKLLHSESQERLCRDVAPLETAGPDEASFLENRKYLGAFCTSRAAAVCGIPTCPTHLRRVLKHSFPKSSRGGGVEQRSISPPVAAQAVEIADGRLPGGSRVSLPGRTASGAGYRASIEVPER